MRWIVAEVVEGAVMLENVARAGHRCEFAAHHPLPAQAIGVSSLLTTSGGPVGRVASL